MSSRRSRSGGTVMTNAPRRKYRSSRNVPAATAARQIAVGRRHDPGVDLDRAFGTHTADFALLKGAQQLRLHRRRHLANFVQKQRPVAGDLEQAGLVPHGTGERPTHMTEELGFQQRFGQRGAVDRHERPSGTRALIVDHPHDELLAGAALAVDQDGRVQRRDPRRELEHVLHGAASAMKCFDAA